MKLQLSWKYQFQFAGFIVAKEMGYYKNAGLDVELLEYHNNDTIQDLEDGKIDFAINNGNILYENHKLRDIYLIATYFQRSPLVLVTQVGIKSPLNIKGKSLSISKDDYGNSSLTMLFEYFSITPKNTHFVKPTFDIEDFVNKKVDIITAFRSNELFALNQRHIPYNVIDPIEYGFTTNAINLFTAKKMISESPESIEAFLKATKKGWEYALSHINEVAKLIHIKYQPNCSLELLEYEGRATKELMLPKLYDIGEINKGFIENNLHQLIKKKKIVASADISQIIYQAKIKKKLEITLTKQEILWLKKHPIVTYSEVNWEPLSIIEENQMQGILGDYMHLISQKTGIKFEYKRAKSWNDVLKMFVNGEIDVVPGIGSSPEEMHLGKTSSIYASYPMAIVTKDNYRYISSLHELSGKTVAVPKDYTSYNFLKKNYPKLNIKATKSIKDALLLVSSSEADAFVGHIAPTLYNMEVLQLKDLKISGTTDFVFEHRYLLHNKENELLSIINKAIASISVKDREELNAKWTHIQVDQGIDRATLYKMAIIFALIGLFFLYRHRELQKYNRRLKSLKERMELALLSSQSGVWDWNIADNKVFFSPEWKKVLGYRDEELENILQTWSSRVHPDDIVWVMQRIDEGNKKQIKEKDFVYRMRKKDGSYIWIHSKSVTEYDAEGKPLRTIGTHINIDRRKKAEEEIIAQKEQLNHLAKHDALTGLPNRILFHDRLDQAISRAVRDKSIVALFFIDLDHFKEINDSLGHDAGDTLLKEVARRLELAIRKIDTLARLGGDEFSVVVGDLKDEKDSIVVANKMIKVLQEPISINGNLLYVSSSIGISFYPKDGLTSANLLKYSDAAMYKAKHEGRNNYQFYSKEMTESAYERVFMEKELREALKNKEFVVFYQPQVNAKKKKITGIEALVRWNHPTMGLLTPAKFMKIAEETGLIVELDRLVMHQALQQLYKWLENGLFSGTLSLNLSMKQLQATDFISVLQNIIVKSGVSTKHIELEVLENQIMSHPEEAIKILNKIRDLDIKLSVDDFGTGYSSLAYLKRLPITKLKIDRSFVINLPTDEDDASIVKAIIALAKSMHLELMAEGVETQEQKEYLIENGCNYIQGYYYSKPMNAEGMQELLKSNIATK